MGLAAKNCPPGETTLLEDLQIAQAVDGDL